MRAAAAAANPIADVVGGTPILILLHPDGRSLRCFDRSGDDGARELFLKEGSNPPVLVDGETGSEWDFTGLATAGSLAGRRLVQVPCLKDFWFDWKTYNPGTLVFAAGDTGDVGDAATAR